MNILISPNEIITASEVVKNFSACRSKAKTTARLFIFKNNKPDLVMLNVSEYERLIELSDALEDSYIMRLLEERAKHDTGQIYSEEDVNKMLDERLANEVV